MRGMKQVETRCMKLATIGDDATSWLMCLQSLLPLQDMWLWCSNLGCFLGPKGNRHLN